MAGNAEFGKAVAMDGDTVAVGAWCVRSCDAHTHALATVSLATVSRAKPPHTHPTCAEEGISVEVIDPVSLLPLSLTEASAAGSDGSTNPGYFEARSTLSGAAWQDGTVTLAMGAPLCGAGAGMEDDGCVLLLTQSSPTTTVTDYCLSAVVRPPSVWEDAEAGDSRRFGHAVSLVAVDLPPAECVLRCTGSPLWRCRGRDSHGVR